jgi:hypothetical protein
VAHSPRPRGLRLLSSRPRRRARCRVLPLSGGDDRA